MRFNVLDRSLNVFQTRFLEASAGTGKTFAIEHLYVRLLIEGESPLKVEQILTVTFTRAATRELRVRLCNSMQSALRDLERGESTHDYLQAQIECGRKIAIQRLRRALACADEMQVFTIHGFCHKMLLEAAFEANEPMDISDPDQGGHKGALKQLVHDFLHTGLDPSSYSGGQLFRMIKSCGHQGSALVRAITNLLEKGVEIDPQPSFDSRRLEVNRFLSHLPSVDREKFIQDFQAVSMNYKGMTHPAFPSQAQVLADILADKECSYENFDFLIKQEKLFLDLLNPGNLKVKIKAINPHYPTLFEQLCSQMLPCIQAALDPAVNLLRVTHGCQSRWDAKVDKTLPDGLLKKMVVCLENPEFLAKARGKYAAAIIDEFQDTDPLQWEVFYQLFFDRAQAFYLVGDPKQSIYAFRNADVHTYLKAKAAIGPSKIAFLDTNYRSAPPLVDALNHLFLFAPHSLGAFDLIPMSGGKPAEETPLQDGKGHVHFFIAEEESSRVKSLPSKRMEDTLLFPFIGEEIQRLRGLGTCAVLVKGKYQAVRLHEFFNQWGIPSVVKRAESLLDSPALSILKELLYAVMAPRDLKKVKRALAGPLFGWSLEQLEASWEHPSLREGISLFRRWHQLYKEKGIGAVCGAVLSHCPLDCTWASAFRQWIELVIGSPEDPLSFLESMGEKDPEDEEEMFKVRQEESEGSVVIMTAHVSKGLEFDFVFALGTTGRHSHTDSYITLNGKLTVLDKKDPRSQAFLEGLDEEKLRLFYVALTRAKRRVYVAWARDAQGELGNAPVELFFKNLKVEPWEVLNALKEKCSLTYSLLNGQQFVLEKEAPQTITGGRTPLQKIPPRPSSRVTSFSALAEKTVSERVELPEGDLPAGADTGHLLHRILEKTVAHPQTLRAKIQEEIAGTPFASWEEKIFAILSPVFDLTFQAEGEAFCLKEVESKNMFQEMEFLFPNQGNFVKGFIDLVIVRNGKYYFIDWKSNLLPNYNQETLAQVMASADYFLQITLYKEALERYFGHFSLVFGGAFYVFLRGPSIYTGSA